MKRSNKSFILNELEKTFTKESIISGKNIFESGRLAINKLPSIDCHLPINWSMDPHTNRTWQWSLNWLSFITDLIAFHHENKDEKIINYIFDIIYDWEDFNLVENKENLFKWHDHATALRLEVLIYVWVYTELNKITSINIKKAKLINLIHLHADKLSEDDFYSKHTNHGLEQARCLFIYGILFEHQNYTVLSLTRIKSEFDFSFTSEGVHVENSPGYHYFVLRVFNDIVRYMESFHFDNIDDDLIREIKSKQEKIINYLEYITRFDGTLPNIGDTDNVKLRHIKLNSNKNLPLSKVYEKSGYAIIKDSWKDTKFHLIYKAGAISNYHYHQDEGNILLWWLGEDWFIDSGRYNYNNKDPIRKYMRSKRAHNVLWFPTKKMKLVEDKSDYWSLQSLNINNQEFESSDLLYEDINKTRKIKVNDNQNIIEVEDKIEIECDNVDYYIDWHLPKNKKIIIEDNKVLIHSSINDNYIEMSISSKSLKNITQLKGIVRDRVHSVTSNKPNYIEDSILIRMSFYSTSKIEKVNTKIILNKNKHIYINGENKKKLRKYDINYKLINFDKLSETSCVLFFFSGAVLDRANKKAPFFSGENISNELGLPAVLISDPFVDYSKDTGIAWYLGSQEEPDIPTEIANLIDSILDKSNKKAILIGGSAGGFAAINISTYMQYDSVVFTWNPQLDMNRYYKHHVDNYKKHAWGGVNYKLNKSSSIQFDKIKKDSKVYILQNDSDAQKITQLDYLATNKKNIKRINNNWFKSNNIFCCVSEWGDGHAPLSKKILVEIIQGLSKGSDIYMCTLLTKSLYYMLKDKNKIVENKLDVNPEDNKKEIKVSGRKVTYFNFPAESEGKPAIFVFHGHGYNGQPAKFRSKNWNVICPIDNFGVENYGSWFLGEKGDYFWLEVIPKIIEEVRRDNKCGRIYFWGSSMGGYASLLHGYLNNVHGIYANIPQTYLLGSKYSNGGMSKYFSEIIGNENDIYNDLTKVFQCRSSKTYFLSFNQLEGSDFFSEQGLRFVNKLQSLRQPMYLEVAPKKEHSINHSIAESIALFKKFKA